MIMPRTDRFLSEEDLDIRNMTWEELVAYWQLWLDQAQSTNDQDQSGYSHGVFRREPAADSAREAVENDIQLQLRMALGRWRQIS